jgi:hypothetical protein
MIFTEFMAEMHRPREFWKVALLSQCFCYAVYMLFGLVGYTYMVVYSLLMSQFVYAKQGQSVSFLPNLNFQNSMLALVTNIISLVSTGVATVLYANIGVKVFYHNVLRAYLRAPHLGSKRGALIWPAPRRGLLGTRMAHRLGHPLHRVPCHPNRGSLHSAIHIHFPTTPPLGILDAAGRDRRRPDLGARTRAVVQPRGYMERRVALETRVPEALVSQESAPGALSRRGSACDHWRLRGC